MCRAGRSVSSRTGGGPRVKECLLITGLPGWFRSDGCTAGGKECLQQAQPPVCGDDRGYMMVARFPSISASSNPNQSLMSHSFETCGWMMRDSWPVLPLRSQPVSVARRELDAIPPRCPTGGEQPWPMGARDAGRWDAGPDAGAAGTMGGGRARAGGTDLPDAAIMQRPAGCRMRTGV